MTGFRRVPCACTVVAYPQADGFGARCRDARDAFGQSIVQHWRREQIFFRDGGRLRRRRDQPALCSQGSVQGRRRE